jgi:hypothetical protein
MGIIFKHQAAVNEEARENSVFLGRTLYYTAERLEESLRKILLREEGFVTGLLNKSAGLNSIL